MTFSAYIQESQSSPKQKAIKDTIKKIERLLKEYKYSKDWDTLMVDDYRIEVWLKVKYDDVKTWKLREKIFDTLDALNKKLSQMAGGKKAGRISGNSFDIDGHPGWEDCMLKYIIYGD